VSQDLGSIGPKLDACKEGVREFNNEQSEVARLTPTQSKRDFKNQPAHMFEINERYGI